jgi:hypothetical protein
MRSNYRIRLFSIAASAARTPNPAFIRQLNVVVVTLVCSHDLGQKPAHVIPSRRMQKAPFRFRVCIATYYTEGKLPRGNSATGPIAGFTRFPGTITQSQDRL